MISCNCSLDDQQQSLTDLDVQQQSLTDIVTINVITYILLTNLIFSGANFLYDFKKYMKDTDLFTTTFSPYLLRFFQNSFVPQNP